ncbi:hypothetical protein GCM10009123_05570 [Kangiella japonica]|uniref:DUF2799 domain-containing protein n=1 Tax=Kangiella japonica TaxID=647384 RepID=A0ABN0SUR2_9GAMM
MKTIITLGSFALLTLLSGCATLSETECASGNWEQIGYKDGKSGRDSDYIIKHESSCIEYGVQLDRETYEAGRQQGLARYCTADNGFGRGTRGSSPNLSCGSQQFPVYFDGYSQGLMSRLERLELDLDEAYKEHEILTEVLRRVKDEQEKDRIELELEGVDKDIDSLQRQISQTNDLIHRYQSYDS